MNFNSYTLASIKAQPGGVYALADSVIRDMAAAFNYPLSIEPDEDKLSGLIAAVGPHKELQRNIEHVQRILGPDAIRIAAAWLKRSGVMHAVSGAFSAPSLKPVPKHVNAVIWTGGVANLQLRRAEGTRQLGPNSTDRVVLPMGDRVMELDEHRYVAAFESEYGRRPTEAEFGEVYVVPMLAAFSVELLSVHSSTGREVCAAPFRTYSELLDGTVLTVGTAPNTIQVAAQLRAAAQRLDHEFDQTDTQLYMVGSSFPLALDGEDKEFAQDPRSGLGQLARNARYLQLAANAA